MLKRIIHFKHKIYRVTNIYIHVYICKIKITIVYSHQKVNKLKMIPIRKEQFVFIMNPHI